MPKRYPNMVPMGLKMTEEERKRSDKRRHRDIISFGLTPEELAALKKPEHRAIKYIVWTVGILWVTVFFIYWGVQLI